MHTEPYYEESLRRDLDLIRRQVLKMATLDEAALRGAMNAMAQKNRQLAYVIILRDRLIDELEDEIDRLCLQFIVRQQPVAGHLRFVYSVLKMVSVLERVGDYAESMARQVVLLHDQKMDIDLKLFQELAETSIPMFRNAVQSFIDRDVAAAGALMELEDVADQLRYKINTQVLEKHAKGKISEDALNPLLTIARRLERVADQAKSICQETLYVVTGESVRHAVAGGFNLLFVDEDNALVSQMAEGIGNALENPNFRFCSAGLKPTVIHPMTVAFMAEKGINISEQKPKAIADVIGCEAIHAVVLLSPTVRLSKLKLPMNTIILEWPIKVPKMDAKDPAALFPFYEKTYAYLTDNIKDLVAAISGENS